MADLQALYGKDFGMGGAASLLSVVLVGLMACGREQPVTQDQGADQQPVEKGEAPVDDADGNQPRVPFVPCRLDKYLTGAELIRQIHFARDSSGRIIASRSDDPPRSGVPAVDGTDPATEGAWVPYEYDDDRLVRVADPATPLVVKWGKNGLEGYAQGNQDATVERKDGRIVAMVSRFPKAGIVVHATYEYGAQAGAYQELGPLLLGGEWLLGQSRVRITSPRIEDKIVEYEFDAHGRVRESRSDVFRSELVYECPDAPAYEPGLATEDSGPVPKTFSPASDRYVVEACGKIRDGETGLEWWVGPDHNVDWAGAKQQIETATVCGNDDWRQPAMDELATLFDPAATAGEGAEVKGRRYPAKMDAAFSGIGSGSWVWTAERKGNGKAVAYNGFTGKPVLRSETAGDFAVRFFAVRGAPKERPTTKPQTKLVPCRDISPPSHTSQVRIYGGCPTGYACARVGDPELLALYEEENLELLGVEDGWEPLCVPKRCCPGLCGDGVECPPGCEFGGTAGYECIR